MTARAIARLRATLPAVADAVTPAAHDGGVHPSSRRSCHDAATVHPSVPPLSSRGQPASPRRATPPTARSKASSAIRAAPRCRRPASSPSTSRPTRCARPTTDQDGYFRFPLLQVGEYQLLVSAPGFADYQHTGIRLSVGTQARVEMPLAVGGTTETVQVTADASMVLRRSGRVGRSAERRGRAHAAHHLAQRLQLPPRRPRREGPAEHRLRHDAVPRRRPQPHGLVDGRHRQLAAPHQPPDPPGHQHARERRGDAGADRRLLGRVRPRRRRRHQRDQPLGHQRLSAAARCRSSGPTTGRRVRRWPP